jgi:hypothetical protein
MRTRPPEIRQADGRWLTYCPVCRRRWESAPGESRSWVDFVATYHRNLHREGRTR